MATLNRIFFRGLITIIPVAVTLYMLFWIVSVMENLVGKMLKLVFPEAFYFPGFGVIATFALIFSFGLLLNNFVMSELVEEFELRLKSIPFFKAIYSPIRDLMNLFSKNNNNNMKNVVLVKFAGGLKIIGVVTREDFSDMPTQLQNQNLATVYCPWSYGMGGFTLLVPKDQLEVLDMPIEKAMSLAITGWVKTDSKFNTENKLNGNLNSTLQNNIEKE
jgi:uncharacterized membrane protein